MEIAAAPDIAGEGFGITDDDRLALEAKADPAAFAALYERHVVRIFRYLRARGAPEDIAADLTATTFEHALVHIDQYRAGSGGFGPWLLRIARNARIDVARRSRPTVDLVSAGEIPALEPSPEDAVVTAEGRRWLLDLLRTLPEAQQDALALRFAAGLSSREIAAVIGKSEAATKKMLTRSLAVLKEATRHDG